jgi:L-alanine-DL-glutamate epimerase-like enolase superfamily enzyme
MPVITAIETGAVRVPLDAVTSFSNRSVRARDFGLVKLHTDSGHTGIGFAYVGTVAGEMLPLAVETLFAKLLIGRDTLETEALWKQMYQEALLQGRAGVVMRAISAIDIALWDVNAKSAGLPLHKYLGATDLDRVPAYASGGYYLEGKTPDKLGEELAHYASLGFKAMKMKTGRLTPRQEEDRLKAAREAVGEDVALMLDVNNGWEDLTQALQYVRRFEKYQPYFIEEPFLVDDLDNHARLARATVIPVATGEVETGHWRQKTLLDMGGAAILQTDAAVCGGITEWRRVAQMASGYGITVMPHAFHDLHAPLVASMPNAPYAEMFLDDKVFNFSRLLDRRMRHENGRIVLHQTPGLGFEFDENILREFSLTRGAGNTPWRRVGE